MGTYCEIYPFWDGLSYFPQGLHYPLRIVAIVLLFYAFALIGLGASVIVKSSSSFRTAKYLNLPLQKTNPTTILILNLRDKTTNFKSANSLLRNTLTSISLN